MYLFTLIILVNKHTFPEQYYSVIVTIAVIKTY